MMFLLETLARASAVVLIGLAITWLLRRQPAALRHWVVGTALMLAALQPALNRVMPAWVLDASRPAPVVTAASSEPGVETATTFEVVRPAVQPASAFDAGEVLLAVWLAGTTLSLAAIVGGMLWLVWLGRRSTAAGAQWIEQEQRILALLGIRRRVRIRVTRHPALLVTWGLFRPSILLPADANTWHPDRIVIVLAHELAHLRRGDWLSQVGAEIVRAICWFNPLFWAACAQLRRESELACDDVVLELGVARTSYAAHLVEIARSFSRYGRTWLPAPSMARPSTLERRVRVMLNPHVNRRPVSRWLRGSLAVILLATALPIAAAAQAPGSTSGRVTDPTGRPLPDATVRMTSVATEAVFETKADATGHFQMPDMPAGEYLISARYPGFSSQRQRIRINGPVTFALQMQVGTLRETITVRGGAATADSATRTVSTASLVPPPPPCGTTEVGGNIKPPRKIRDVRPRYKQAWASTNPQGTVLLQALIGVDGRVKNVEVVSTADAEMEEEAMAAVSQWEFTPTYLNCEAVEVRMFVTVSFTAEQ